MGGQAWRAPRRRAALALAISCCYHAAELPALAEHGPAEGQSNPFAQENALRAKEDFARFANIAPSPEPAPASEAELVARVLRRRCTFEEHHASLDPRRFHGELAETAPVRARRYSPARGLRRGR
jgi:hypothetical protein